MPSYTPRKSKPAKRSTSYVSLARQAQTTQCLGLLKDVYQLGKDNDLPLDYDALYSAILGLEQIDKHTTTAEAYTRYKYAIHQLGIAFRLTTPRP